MQNPSDERYGLVGWREFHNSRKEILAEFDRAKGYNVSRPVRTEHGPAGEAALRKWLSSFLPKKFGVTSGFVIPDLMGEDTKLYHFDIVIYDAINSPILWTDGDGDHSEQGRRRAIPAKHVHAAFESKASLSARDASDAVQKLSQFTPLAGHLPKNFSCGAVFFDLDPALANNKQILPNLLPQTHVLGYWGGLVLRCSLDVEMSGLLELLSPPESLEEAKSLDIPIAKPLQELDVHRDERGNVTLRQQGAGVTAFSGPDKQWHFSKQYGPIVYGPVCGLRLAWSYNAFADFALDLLSRLEGVPLTQTRQYMFGQVFDAIR